MSAIPSAGEIQAARDGLLSVESLLVRLVDGLRLAEEQNAALERELIETRGQRDALATRIRSAEEALGISRAAPAPLQQPEDLIEQPCAGPADRDVAPCPHGKLVRKLRSLRGPLRCPDCQLEHRRRTSASSCRESRANAETERVCVECSALFTPEKRNGGRPQTCCSDPCRVKHRRKQTVEWTRANRRDAGTREAAGNPNPPVSSVETPQPPTPQPHKVESKVVTPPVLDRYRREQEQKTASGAFDPAKVALQERRCGRCCHKYQPTAKDDYYCASCRAAIGKRPAPPARVDTDLVSTGWNGRDPLPNKADPEQRGLGSGLSPGLLARSGH